MRRLSEKPPPTPAPGDGKCPPFWFPYGRYCYYVHDGQQGFSWPDSRHYCQSVRGDLASIHSRAEVEFIRNLNYTKYHHIWIGLTRDNNCEFGSGHRKNETNVFFESQFSSINMMRICILTSFDFAVGWAWTDKTSLGFTNWAPNEPNFAFHPGDVAEENCVEMYHDGHWNDNNCLEKRGFVCRHRQCKDLFYYHFTSIPMWKTEFPQLFYCGF